MRTRAALLVLLTAVMMPAARGQEKADAGAIRVATIDVGQPVADFLLCDLGGDGINDAVFVTKTRPALCVVAPGNDDGATFAAPLGFEIAGDCDGLIVQPTPGGAAILVLANGAVEATRAAAFSKLPGARLSPGVPPPFLGFAQDFDGDAIGDPLLPVADGFDLTLSRTARSVPVRPPGTSDRRSTLRGLVSERRTFPLVSFEILRAAEAPLPLFFANDALERLSGTMADGFGPGTDTLLRVPSPKTDATLERTEARLVDVEGDGERELLIARTKTQGTALAQVRTELIFHRIDDTSGGRPAQALLLPGVLSSGPELKDIDGDGRLDLFLSVFGEEMSNQLSRRITGKVKLQYLLYRGISGAAPFARAPEFTETDSVPEATFSDWSLRHRLLLDDDWTGDGRPDLVHIVAGAQSTMIEIRAGGIRSGKAGFEEKPSLTATAPARVLDLRAWRLSATTPAMIARTESGAVIFSRALRSPR